MTFREEHLSDSVRLSSGRPFCLHVAAGAQTDQIRSAVGFLCRGKFTKRPNVIDGQAFANMLAAVRAISSLRLYDGSPCGEPAAAPIRLRAANPIRRPFSGFLARLKLPVAILGAKAAAGFCPVLTGKPRFNREQCATIGAVVSFSGDEIDRACSLWGKGVRGRLAPTPSVSDFVSARHLSRRHMPCTAARKAAKSGPLRAIRLHLKGLIANFTLLGDWHNLVVSQ